ncbi:MAG: hypothetical protein AB1479_08390 [Pseudomonadota bacterium]
MIYSVPSWSESSAGAAMDWVGLVRELRILLTELPPGRFYALMVTLLVIVVLLVMMKT